jgi:hypothetical protein
MMAKTDSLDQHAALHGFWPNNCCLCNAEARIAALEESLAAEQLAEADSDGRQGERRFMRALGIVCAVLGSIVALGYAFAGNGPAAVGFALCGMYALAANVRAA